MKTLAAVIGLVAATSWAAPSAAAAVARRPRIAIIDLRPLSIEKEKVEALSEVAIAEAARCCNAEVVGGSDIRALLGVERMKAVMGCEEDSSCVTELGGSLGVDYLVVGSVGKVGTATRVDLKLLDATASKVVDRFGEWVPAGEEYLIPMVQRGVRQLVLKVATAKASEEQAVRAASLEGGRAQGLSRQTWGWIAVAGGALAVAGGGVTGILANSSLDQVRQASEAGDLTAYQDAQRAVRTRAGVADGLFVVGGLAVAGGAYLLLTDRAPKVAIAPVQGGAVATFQGTLP